MRRKIYSELLAWKDSPERKPLILDGVRQCGKTYILKEFGRREFESVAYLDLEKRKDLRPLFGDNLEPMRIVKALSSELARRIVPGRTLIILDEVQACPRAFTALKYFKEDLPQQHIVVAGSLLGVLTSTSESFPVGKVDRLRMYPMSFLEFLDACGETSMCGMLEGLGPNDAMEPAFQSKLEDYLRQYYVVGGMPDVVGSWVRNHNVAAVTRKLRTIIKDYEEDFSKHAEKDLQKLTEIWESIPVQIARENNRFMFSHVREGGRAENLSDALRWIVDAGLAYRVPQVQTPGNPLKSVCDESKFKVYLCDIGILRVMSGKKASFIRSDDPDDRLYKGAMTENYVLCQMLSGGLKDAFYWRDGTHEVDFLIDGGDGAVPVEVKSESPGGYASLKEYINRYGPKGAYLASMKPRYGGTGFSAMPLFRAEFIPTYAGVEDVEVDSFMVKEGRPFVQSFSVSDWSEGGNGFEIRVPRSTHGIPMPSVVQVYIRGPQGFTEVMVAKTLTMEGDVVLGTNSPFDGFVSVM